MKMSGTTRITSSRIWRCSLRASSTSYPECSDASEHVVNASLWSLPGELWLYVLLFVLFVASGRLSAVTIPLGALLLGVVWSALPRTGHVWLDPIPHDVDALLFSRLGTFFLSGATLACSWQ